MAPERHLHRVPIRVCYADTDAGGVVYHATYLRFYEIARTEWMRSLGLDHHGLMREHGILFAVCRVEIEYRKPAVLDDLLDVSVVSVSAGRTSIRFEQSIACDGQQLSSAHLVLVCAQMRDGAPRSARIPEPVARLIPSPPR